MARIFISYSRQDKDFVKELVPILRRVYDFDSVWYDHEIHGGEDWWLTILKEIDNCELFIYLLSDDSLKSHFCQSELTEAVRLNKAILPVLVRPETDLDNAPANLVNVLKKTHYVDLTGRVANPYQMADLQRSIRKILTPLPSGKKRVSKNVLGESGDSNLRLKIIAAMLVIVIIGVAVVVINRLTQPPGEITATEEVVVQPSETPLIDTPVPVTDTPEPDTVVPTPTPDIAATHAAETAIAQIKSTEQSLNATMTQIAEQIFAQQTADAQATQEALNPAPTTTLWTPTPTEFPSVIHNDDWTPMIQEFDGVEMVLVPPGCFMMGSEDGEDNEKPVHEQCFDKPFWIDRFEVSNKQYVEFNGQAKSKSEWTEDNHPRENVTWFEARDFCISRDARLPTEAEWEYAARGPDNLIYPWGNSFIASNVQYFDNSLYQTMSVGSKQHGVSWVGALAMSGNVWEWTNTIYQQYPYDANDGREGEQPYNRVLRGGSWSTPIINLATFDRRQSIPDNQSKSIGFRCAHEANTDTMSIEPSETTLAIQVSSLGANIRSGPGTEYTVLGDVQGETLPIIEISKIEGKTWYRVKLPNGEEGWIADGTFITVVPRDE